VGLVTIYQWKGDTSFDAGLLNNKLEEHGLL
jgi:hypothetical protein